MNWRLILTLSAVFGLLMTVAAVMGWLSNTALEFGVWIGAAAFIAVFLANNGGRGFSNGFMTGLLVGLIQQVLVIALWDTFIANNPQFIEQMAKDMPGQDPKQAALMMALPIALVWGLFQGFLAWLMGKVLKRPEVNSPHAASTD